MLYLSVPLFMYLFRGYREKSFSKVLIKAKDTITDPNRDNGISSLYGWCIYVYITLPGQPCDIWGVYSIECSRKRVSLNSKAAAIFCYSVDV